MSVVAEYKALKEQRRMEISLEREHCAATARRNVNVLSHQLVMAREMEEDKMASWNCLMRPMLLQEFPHRNRPTHWNEDGFFRTVVCPM